MIELSSPDFSHVIIAISERDPNDANYHINFYKLMETDPGVYVGFDYKLDAIQIPITEKKLDA